MPLSFHRLLIVALGAVAVSWGCARKPFDGPTVDAFNGRLTRKGEPVSFPAEEKVTLKVILHRKGESFGIPIQPDGTFKIGWMPIGKYSAMLIRENKAPAERRGPPQNMYNVPNGFAIEEGQTEYLIELGSNWKP
jgi:hypothetical protein